MERWYAAGWLAYSQSDYAAARARYEESFALKPEVGDKQGIADLLANLGSVAYQRATTRGR